MEGAVLLCIPRQMWQIIHGNWPHYNENVWFVVFTLPGCQNTHTLRNIMMLTVLAMCDCVHVKDTNIKVIQNITHCYVMFLVSLSPFGKHKMLDLGIDRATMLYWPMVQPRANVSAMSCIACALAVFDL